MGGHELNKVILFFIIVEIIIVTMIISKTRNTCKTVIAEAYRSMNYFIGIGFFWFAICSFWIYFCIDNLKDVLYLFDGEHIKSVYQLFDLNYLKNLANHFMEIEMHFEAMDIIFYRRTLLKTITWIIISSGNSIAFLYRGFQKQKICTNILMTYGGNHRWNSVTEYSLKEEVEKGKLKYFSLYIKIKRKNLESKLLNDELQEVKLRLNIDHKEKIDKFLRETIDK